MNNNQPLYGPPAPSWAMAPKSQLGRTLPMNIGGSPRISGQSAQMQSQPTRITPIQPSHQPVPNINTVASGTPTQEQIKTGSFEWMKDDPEWKDRYQYYKNLDALQQQAKANTNSGGFDVLMAYLQRHGAMGGPGSPQLAMQGTPVQNHGQVVKQFASKLSPQLIQTLKNIYSQSQTQSPLAFLPSGATPTNQTFVEKAIQDRLKRRNQGSLS